jgi:hypothetical protein
MAKAAKGTRKSTAKKAARKTARSTMAPAKRAARKATKTAAKSTSRKLPARKIPGISRVDQDSTRTHGWVVRLNYEQTASGWRPKHTAYFGDATHGGPNKSLAAAEEYLKKLQRSSKKK